MGKILLYFAAVVYTAYISIMHNEPYMVTLLTFEIIFPLFLLNSVCRSVSFSYTLHKDSHICNRKRTACHRQDSGRESFFPPCQPIEDCSRNTQFFYKRQRKTIYKRHSSRTEYPGIYFFTGKQRLRKSSHINKKNKVL